MSQSSGSEPPNGNAPATEAPKADGQELARRSEQRRRKKRVARWEDSVEVRLDRQRVDLGLARSVEDNPLDRPETHEIIRKSLDDAERVLDRYRRQGWLRRFLSRPAVYEYIESVLGENAASLLLIIPDDSVRARVPHMRAELKRHIGSADARYDAYARLLDSLEGAHR
jgi:hypothetical protein